jgi:hypothetical protein
MMTRIIALERERDHAARAGGLVATLATARRAS